MNATRSTTTYTLHDHTQVLQSYPCNVIDVGNDATGMVHKRVGRVEPAWRRAAFGIGHVDRGCSMEAISVLLFSCCWVCQSGCSPTAPLSPMWSVRVSAAVCVRGPSRSPMDYLRSRRR